MIRFLVEFRYGTDIRCDWRGEAMNEAHALMNALAHNNIMGWTRMDSDFYIKITRC